MLKIGRDAVSIGYCLANNLLGSSRAKETVLLYHSLSDKALPADNYRLNIPFTLFCRHLEYLKNKGSQQLVLTFDDGYENFFEIAFPLLLRYNVNSILFITVGFIDGLVSSSEIFKNNLNLKPLSWKQVKEISCAGIEIGSHSLTHPVLSWLDNQSARAEIEDSKKRIEEVIGKKVRYFAYPFGATDSFNPRIKEIIKESGYEKAYTNIMGFNTQVSNPWELKRIRIYSDDNLFRFKLKLSGGYNWTDVFRRKGNP